MTLDTQNGFAFLEALTPDISVESLGRNFDSSSAHIGMKVRPTTSGNTPSSLQLLPGQSFYIGKTTLSLVPEEHRDLPVHSSDLPDSNFESYNQQVSQISTPRQTARFGSTIMETPIPLGHYESEVPTPILERLTEHAMSGSKDTKKRQESPLKREVMRTVREASGLGHSNSTPEFEKGYEQISDAAINEPDRSSSQPVMKNEDEDVADATAANTTRPYLEDTEMVAADLGSECLEKSEPLSSLKSCVHPKGESGSSNRAPVAQVQPERGPEALDRSPILQATSESYLQLDDDLDDTPMRKKARTKAVSPKALTEDSQDSLQNEGISVKRRISATKDCPVSASFASSKVPDPRFANQPKQRSSTLSTEPQYVSAAITSDSRSRPANPPPSESSFNSSRPTNPRTPRYDGKTISASPSDSVEANSSMRSTRSTVRDEHNGSSSPNASIRIVFASSSSAGDSKPFLKFLSSKGVKKVQSMHDCTVLCVGKELKKTSKLILAVLLGKDIITDSWVTDSIKGNDLLSVEDYSARDLKKEAEWGFSLDEAIDRGKRGFKVLQDQTIVFTPSVKKELGRNGFDELKEIVKGAGARGVSSALPKKTPEETSSTLVVATHDSTEVAELQALGWRVYAKDIISLSILRGKLDLGSDEFLIKEQKKESRKRKR